jgi:predicted PurR-regulated permease PerM
LKKIKKQNAIIISFVLVIIGAIVWYNYSVDQTKQKGFKFGNDLQQIQEDVKQLQIKFNSQITQWKEGDLSKQELLVYSTTHIEKLQSVISKYDELLPPQQFSSSVELFKLSSQTQLDSDKELIEWIKTNDTSHNIRSDSLLQESFEYEMTALGEYNAAKSGLR